MMKDYKNYYGVHYRGDRYLNFCFNDFPQFFMNDELLYSVTPAPVAAYQSDITTARTVFIPFCGSGMDAIYFIKSHRRVLLADTSRESVLITKKNLQLILSKSTYEKYAEIKRLSWQGAFHFYREKYDFIYLDPPWGGPEYPQLPVFTLDTFQDVDSSELLSQTLRVTKNALMKVPNNFRMEELRQFDADFLTHYIKFEDRVILVLIQFGSRGPDVIKNFSSGGSHDNPDK